MKKLLLAGIGLLVIGAAVQGCKSNTGQAPVPAPPQATQQQTVTPTPLKKGETPEERVEAYFDAYKGGKLDESFDLQPKFNQARQTKEQYTQLRKSMPISGYKVLPVQNKGDQRIIEVEYDISGYGTWVSSWLFEKKNGDWSAMQYQASSK